MKPRLLDLFAGAGGSAVGYARAGFDVVGIDIRNQRHYPFEFHQGDVMDLERVVRFMAVGFDAIHASPPCQAYSVTGSLHRNRYPSLIGRVRELLEATGLPYVIENVVGAPLVDAFQLCGSSFGLGVRRHRLFETRPLLLGVPPCAHHLQPEPIDVTGTGGPSSKPRTGGGIHRKPRNLEAAREAMGISWMSRLELSEAVPPAFTEWIGVQLLASLRASA